MHILFFSLTVFIAALLQASLGFGFPIVSMAILPLFMGYSRAVAIVQAVATVSTVYLSLKHFRKIRWDVLLPVLIPSAVFGAVFTVFSMTVEARLLYILLGFFFIVLSLYNFFLSSRLKVNASVKNGIIMGIVAGVGNGLFSIGGPTTALYLLGAMEDRIEYFACMQAFFSVCNIINLGLRLGMGSLMFSDFGFVALGWILMLLGTFAGQRLLLNAKEAIFRKAVYLLILADGIWMVVSNLF